MIKPEQIPDEAVAKACEVFKGKSTNAMRLAIADAINAWPYAVASKHGELFFVHRGDVLLPLQQENNDD